MRTIIVGPAFPLRGGIANLNESLCKAFLDNGIETLNELKRFDIDGYGFSAEYTLNENEPVFVR